MTTDRERLDAARPILARRGWGHIVTLAEEAIASRDRIAALEAEVEWLRRALDACQDDDAEMTGIADDLLAERDALARAVAAVRALHRQMGGVPDLLDYCEACGSNVSLPHRRRPRWCHRPRRPPHRQGASSATVTPALNRWATRSAHAPATSGTNAPAIPTKRTPPSPLWSGGFSVSAYPGWESNPH